jgi:hypothetical protein
VSETKIKISVYPDLGVRIEVSSSTKVRHLGVQDDLGYETDVKTYEDDEGILYDNLD